MPSTRHEIPTHLDVEDRAIFGLTFRQVMLLIVGVCGAAALWSAWPGLPLGGRGALAALALVAAALLALVRPCGRGLEDWAFVALRYLTTPKRAVWRPEAPDVRSGDQAQWETLAPRLAWRDEEATP